MSFITLLKEIRDGETLARINEDLLELVDSVSETGKAGSLTVTLNFKQNGESAMTVAPSVKAKKPEAALGDALFFVTSGGTLTRRNPRQMDIEDELASRRAGKEAAAGADQ